MIVQAFDVVLLAVYFILLFLSLFWLLVFFTVQDDKKPQKTGPLPKFTVIVPAFNEERAIIRTLQSLVLLDYPKEKKEIIVVNDGSTDATQQLVERFVAQHPNDAIVLLNQKNGGKGSAMNNGLRIASGEYFACLDADSHVEPNALREMLPYFENPTVGAVCPLLKVNKPGSLIEKVQWYEYVVNMFYKYLNAKIDCIHVTPGPFSIYRTDVIRGLGGYDETTITEDLEIAIRLQKHHYKIVQTFDAVVHTNAPKTWKHLFRQRVRWYRGSIDNSLKYKSLILNRRYGDFGIIRMPTILLSGILTIIVTVFLFRDLAIKGIRDIKYLDAINFDILTLLRAWEFQLDLLNLPYFRYIIGLTLIGLGLFVMVYSYKIVGEKITNHGRTAVSLFFYLFLYSFFLSMVWMYIAYEFTTQRRTRWA